MLDEISMSSDDELLEDMMHELEEEEEEIIHPAPRAPVARAPAAQTPVASHAASNMVRKQQQNQGMPDFSQMMNQMMPMMSQMFGGGGGMNMAPPRSTATISRDIRDIIADHIPKEEVNSWVETIRRDERRQQEERIHGQRHQLSRSYQMQVAPMPSAHLNSAELLQELLIEAVNNAKCNASPAWEKDRLQIHTELSKQGVDNVYKKELHTVLQKRVKDDEDYLANKTRFANISATIMA